MKFPISDIKILHWQYILIQGLAISSVLVNFLLFFLLIKEQDYHWQAIAWQDWGDLAFQIMTSILLLLLAHQFKVKYQAHKPIN